MDASFLCWFFKYFLVVLAVFFLVNYFCDRIEQGAYKERMRKDE